MRGHVTCIDIYIKATINTAEYIYICYGGDRYETTHFKGSGGVHTFDLFGGGSVEMNYDKTFTTDNKWGPGIITRNNITYTKLLEDLLFARKYTFHTSRFSVLESSFLSISRSKTIRVLFHVNFYLLSSHKNYHIFVTS